MKIDTDKLTPVCPHCAREVERLVRVDRGWFVNNHVFCCPHCKKIVGMTGVGGW